MKISFINARNREEDLFLPQRPSYSHAARDNLHPANPGQQGALRGKVSALANSCTHIYPLAAIYGEGGLSPDVTPWDVASAREGIKGTAVGGWELTEKVVVRVTLRCLECEKNAQSFFFSHLVCPFYLTHIRSHSKRTISMHRGHLIAGSDRGKKTEAEGRASTKKIPIMNPCNGMINDCNEIRTGLMTA